MNILQLTLNRTYLSRVGLEHEVFNVDTMQQLVTKLPWAQVEKWRKFLEAQGEEAKNRPFKTFLEWLEKAGGSWEIIVASGIGQACKERTGHHAFHMEAEGSRGKVCFSCRKKSHPE